jgi:DNA-binding IclR family transcriptional regulator
LKELCSAEQNKREGKRHMTTDSTGRSIIRIADILNCFSVEEPVHTLTAISKRLELPKSTTHRLLTTLVGQGFLMRDVHGRGYQLGYQLLHWGMVAQAALDLRNEALPILRALSKSVGETAILTVRDGMRGLYLEIVESGQPVRLTMQVGRRLRLHAGASSKVLLAFLPEADIEQIVNAIELLPLTSNTITDPALLRAELAAIRQRGYATSFEETDLGAMGIAAPVYDRTGDPVAGIGIAAPLARIPPERVPEAAPAVIEAGQQLSARLGAPRLDTKRHT